VNSSRVTRHASLSLDGKAQRSDDPQVRRPNRRTCPRSQPEPISASGSLPFEPKGANMSVLLWSRSAIVLSVCLSLPLLIEAGRASAGDGADPDAIETREVVISATKTPVPVTQLTSAVDIITEEDLKSRKIRTVAEALRFVPGVTVFSNGGPGTTTTARIRGSNADQVLVLIDGAIMNSATLGSFNFANLTTDNIERIEVLRGAQSMLWGADAMGGVINIVTKRGAGPATASAFFEYGSFSSIREGGQVFGQKGPIDFTAALSRWDFTGFSQVNYRRGASERDAFRNWQGSGRVGVALPRDGRLDLSFRLLQGKVNIDNGFSPGFDVLGGFSGSQQFIYSASYLQPITAWWSQALTASRQTESLETRPGTIQRNVLTGVVSTPFGNPSEINTLANRLEWQHNFQIGKPLLVSAGYQFRDQQGENINLTSGTTPISNRIISSHAGFAQAQLNLWDRVFATAGIRQDDYNVFGSATTYRTTVGYLHHETGTKVRATYATGFRAPTINQLFFPDFGKPDLKPEKSKSMDVGVDQYLLNGQLTLSATYFWNRFQDLIVAQQSATVCGVGDFGANFCAQNIGEVSSKGWEASVRYTVVHDRPGVKNLYLQGQYTHTMTRNLSQPGGNRQPRFPVDQWSLVVGYQPIEPLLVSLEGRYVGSRFEDVNNLQRLGSFDVWNLVANYGITKYVQAYVRAENLFNEKYEEILNFGTAVRSVFVGVKLLYN
jgi:vitamin B12 transporter